MIATVSYTLLRIQKYSIQAETRQSSKTFLNNVQNGNERLFEILFAIRFDVRLKEIPRRVAIQSGSIDDIIVFYSTILCFSSVKSIHISLPV